MHARSLCSLLVVAKETTSHARSTVEGSNFGQWHCLAWKVHIPCGHIHPRLPVGPGALALGVAVVLLFLL